MLSLMDLIQQPQQQRPMDGGGPRGAPMQSLMQGGPANAMYDSIMNSTRGGMGGYSQPNSPLAPVQGAEFGGMSKQDADTKAILDEEERKKAILDRQRRDQYMSQNPGTGMANTFAGAPPIQQAPTMAGLMAMVNSGGR